MAQVNIDPELLESCVRNELNKSAPRVMAVLQPLKVIIDNFEQIKCSHEVTIADFPDSPEKVKIRLPRNYPPPRYYPPLSKLFANVNGTVL